MPKIKCLWRGWNIIVWKDIQTHTHKTTHTHTHTQIKTHRQTNMTENITYPNLWTVMISLTRSRQSVVDPGGTGNIVIKSWPPILGPHVLCPPPRISGVSGSATGNVWISQMAWFDSLWIESMTFYFNIPNALAHLYSLPFCNATKESTRYFSPFLFVGLCEQGYGVFWLWRYAGSDETQGLWKYNVNPLWIYFHTLASRKGLNLSFVL